MGANSSKIEEFIINKSFPLIDYDVTVRKFDNIYSGDIQVIQNKYNPNDIKLMKEHHHIDYNSLEIELEKLDNLIKINNECPNLLKVFGYSHIKDSIFCGKIQKFYIISEYLDLSLKNEIKTRTLEKKPFTENEIFKLIKDVTFALRHLKQKNIKYDFLKTKSIFIGKNNFKILLPSLFNIIPNYLEFMRISNKEDFEVFLSPEALKNIKEKWISVNFDQFKSDIFVLGCIALEVMGKFTCLDLINVQNMEINLKLLEKAIKTIQKEFTETHWRLIKDMLEENPDKRIGLDEILKRLDHINPIITEEPSDREPWQKIRMTHNKTKRTKHNISSMTELNQFNDENLTKFDESKKVLQTTRSQTQTHIEKKTYSNIPFLDPKPKYELVEEIFKDGSVYKGEKLNQNRHGKGKFIYSDGGIYEGDWKFGKMDGYGVLYYGDQSIAYEGEWKEDKFEGRGILYNEKNSIQTDEKYYDLKNLDNLNDFWVKFEGNFKEDKKEGSGILFFPNGNRLSGKFMKDKLCGKNCILYKKDGEILKGEWDNNILIKLA